MVKRKHVILIILSLFLCGCYTLDVYTIDNICDQSGNCGLYCSHGKYNFNDMNFKKDFEKVEFIECENLIGIKRKTWFRFVKPRIEFFNSFEKLD